MHERANTARSGSPAEAISRPSASQTATWPRWMDSIRPERTTWTSGTAPGLTPFAQLRTSVGSSRYRRFSSSWRASRTRITSTARVRDFALLGRQQVDRGGELLVVEGRGVGDAGVGYQALDPPAGEQHLLLGKADADRLAAGAPGCARHPPGSGPGGRPADRGPHPASRASSSARRISARPWTSRRRSDRYSRSARHSSRRARRSIERQLVQISDVGLVADPVDAAVAGVVGRSRRPSYARRGSADGEKRLVRVDRRAAARVVLEVQVVDARCHLWRPRSRSPRPAATLPDWPRTS